MNPRKVALKYLGWCPGVASASQFIPDREIPNSIFFLISLFTIILIGGYVLTLPDPLWEPKIITINGQTYNDSKFSTDYDYSNIINKKIVFYQPVNSSEFINGESKEIEFELVDLIDLEEFLLEQKTPNIVTGYSIWLANGSWEEALSLYNYTKKDQITSIGETFGVRSSSYVQYSVIRQSPNFSPSGLMIKKMYNSEPGVMSPIWVLNIRVDSSPPYQCTFFKAGKK
jgi:hypothetical protein